MKVAVVGAGTMGPGIAQVSAAAGYETALVDVDGAQLDRALATMRSSLDRLVAKDRLTADDAAAAIGRVEFETDLGNAATGAGVVIESVVEAIEVKRAVLSEVVECAPRTALIGSNTSQLSITKLASFLGDSADRLVGLHFFNPPVLMRLVEIVKGLQTSEETIDRAVDFSTSLGKDTVVCRKDSPGFLTSRVSAIVRLECLRMLEEGVASAADIDKALRLGLNFPMGPLELGDFNGLDTYLHVLESLEETLGDRFRPTVTLRNLVAAGLLGRKSGRGIYRYTDDGTIIPE